jgi:hypothetical protein
VSREREFKPAHEDDMNGLSDIFRSDAGTEIFCFSSIVFLLVYAAGFFSLQRWSRTVGRTPAVRRHFISGLGAAVAAMGIGFALHAANVTIASAKAQGGPAATISPRQLHRAIEMKALPVQEIEDRTFVFPN